MIIAISQRNDKNKHGENIDSLESSYVNYFERFGSKLVVIPNSTRNVEHYFEKFPISGIILSGGNDINPGLYSSSLKEGLSVSKDRDEVERKMLEIAVKKKLPVLGICRGMQFINVFFNGQLINIKDEIKNSEHVAVNHSITIEDKRLNKILGKVIDVNSYHNQGINLHTLSASLKAFAKAGDGVIEGIYHASLPIVGVQWHPERKSPDEKSNEKIVNAFLSRELFWK